MAQLKDLLVNGDARTLGTLYGNHGAVISGRAVGGGDDEGLVIGLADNNYAGICLGNPNGLRSVFYLTSDSKAVWRYNNGTGYDITHPGKAGTIALTSDISDKNVQTALQSDNTIYVTGTKNTGTATGTLQYNTGVTIIKNGGVLMGAAWNDYAEYRESDCQEPGRVICENGNDTLSLATKRLQPGAEIISDTFGFAIGKTDKAQTPIAVSGRVLAYTYEDRNSYKPGDAVCAAPGGTVSKMTREEIREYPERIIGTVSAIPEYETWGTGNVPVNGRIWIKIK